MAQPTAAPAEMIPQLEAARRLVLGDAHFYPQIVPGILPIIGPGAPLEVRRWGADFLAETFASPALGNAQKDELSSVVLPNLRGLLEIPGEDAAVVKSVVQTVASVYSLVFRKWYVTQFHVNLRRFRILHHVHLLCSSSQLPVDPGLIPYSTAYRALKKQQHGRTWLPLNQIS
jgi:symplekin